MRRTRKWKKISTAHPHVRGNAIDFGSKLEETCLWKHVHEGFPVPPLFDKTVQYYCFDLSFLFSRRHATLHLAVWVGPSVPP